MNANYTSSTNPAHRSVLALVRQPTPQSRPSRRSTPTGRSSRWYLGRGLAVVMGGAPNGAEGGLQLIAQKAGLLIEFDRKRVAWTSITSSTE